MFVSNNISGRRFHLPRRRTKKIKQRSWDLLTVPAGRHSTSSDENCEKSKDNGLSWFDFHIFGKLTSCWLQRGIFLTFLLCMFRKRFWFWKSTIQRVEVTVNMKCDRPLWTMWHGFCEENVHDCWYNSGDHHQPTITYPPPPPPKKKKGKKTRKRRSLGAHFCAWFNSSLCHPFFQNVTKICNFRKLQTSAIVWTYHPVTRKRKK